MTTPALAILLQVNQQTAQGLSFTAMPFALMVGILAYRKEKSIDFRSAMRVGIPGAVGVYLGGLLACNMSSSVLRSIFGVALLIISVPLAMKKRPVMTNQAK